MKHGKIWGTTELIYRNPLIEVHRLLILPGSHCSWHVHERKSNMFICMQGHLKIQVRKNDYDLTDDTLLNPGEVTTVPPGEYHRFVTETDWTGKTLAFEVYYPEPLGKDIIRENVGGCTEELEDSIPTEIVSPNYKPDF